jgi:hypothetical protein
MTNAATREDLLGIADAYLDSLALGDAARVSIAADARVTENTCTCGVGEGLWKTATGVRYRQRVADASSGQVAVYAVVDEGGTPAIVGLRLAVREGRICEIETLVSRAGQSSIFSPELLVAEKPIFGRLLKPAERAGRAAMIATANAYFDGIEHNTGAGVSFDPQCQRTENGAQTTSTPRVLRGLGCKEQLEQKVFAYITQVRERRFPIVDEERGLVWGAVFLDVPGTVASVEVEGRTYELPERMRKPRSTLVFEVFKVQSGQIREIEAFMINLPFGTTSGW